MTIDLDDDAPGLDDVIAALARHEIGQTHGPIPARVLAYDPATQRATVQAVVASTDPDGLPVPAPVRQGVPVAWPAWSTGSITWPLTVGSWVMLVPQDADVSAWAQAGTTGQAPPTPRSCAMTDVIALPLCGVPASAPLAAIGYAADGTVFNGTVYLGGSTATDFAAMAGLVLQRLNTLQNAHDTHQHLETGGTTGVPTVLAGAMASVASTKAKVL